LYQVDTWDHKIIITVIYSRYFKPSLNNYWVHGGDTQVIYSGNSIILCSGAESIYSQLRERVKVTKYNAKQASLGDNNLSEVNSVALANKHKT